MSLKEEVDKIVEKFDPDSEEFFDELESKKILITDLEDLASFGEEFVPEKLPEEEDFQDTVTVEIYIPKGFSDLFYKFLV